VSGIADPFNGHIDEFRISHVQRSDGWIATAWNNTTRARLPWPAPRSKNVLSRYRLPALAWSSA
jgi:hypothetical protein